MFSRPVIVNGSQVAELFSDTNLTDQEWQELEAVYTNNPSSLSHFVNGVIPDTVSPYGMRKALRELNYYNQIESSISTAPPQIQDYWEYTLAFNRDDLFSDYLKTTIPCSQVELDNIFKKASEYA